MLLGSMRSLSCTFACLFLLATAACGYRLGAHPCESPIAAKSIAIPLFENDSFEPRLENLFTKAFRERIKATPCVSLGSGEEADALLKGRVVSVDTYKVAVNEEFLAVEYRMRVVLAVSLERRVDGKVLWRQDRLEEEVPFYATSDPLLFNDNREEALMRLSSRMSEKVVDRLLLGF
jgi:Lipopolysaccharide-assembly